MSASGTHLSLPVPSPGVLIIAPAQPPQPVLSIQRRRPDIRQGVALEILGHAIEYLIDSSMIRLDEPPTPAEREAVEILSRCSRQVFAECSEIVPIHQRFRQWAIERLKTRGLQTAPRAEDRPAMQGGAAFL